LEKANREIEELNMNITIKEELFNEMNKEKEKLEGE